MNKTSILKIENFLNKISSDIYNEPVSEVHRKITIMMFDHIRSSYPLDINARILDVGCGQGYALDIFKKFGFNSVGITLGENNLNLCQGKGHEVYKMDQSFLDFPDKSFNLVWCRHCLEHSIFPYYTLSEFFRVLKVLGYLYIEVPAPDTDLKHQTNPNHYSVFGKSMWVSLIERTGFKILEIKDIPIQFYEGKDMYWAFIVQKL